jgi:hypothetical protein
VILASIFIGPPGRGEDLALPPTVEENIASLKRHHPGLPHRLFSDEDILAFLKAKFPREVLDAYNTLKPYSYKADLARYCILYELGGIYADLAYYFARALPFDGKRTTVFRDLFLSSPWDTNTSVIAAPPRQKALELAIGLVCANVKRRYYGPTPLCPTGPAMFGKALSTACFPEELIVGNSAAYLRGYVGKRLPGVALPETPRLHCLLFGEDIFVVKRKPVRVAGLADLGIANSDDYLDRWQNRDIYGDSTP